MVETGAFKVQCACKHLGACYNADSNSVGLDWELRICISKLLGHAHPVGPQTTTTQSLSSKDFEAFACVKKFEQKRKSSS